MSLNSRSIWELAEAYVAGSLSQEDFAAVKARLSSDAPFAQEFYEATDLVRSMANSGKEKRFRTMLRSIHERQSAPVKPAKTPWRIELKPQTWRTAAVAASVAILTSVITYWSVHPSLKKSESQYNTISREVTNLKKVQQQQQVQQNQLIQDIKKVKTQAPPPSDVKYTGTGFALTNDGYFVTSYHVIHDNNGYGDSVYIQNHEGQYFKASLINFDAKADLAILKVEKNNFHFGKGELPYSFETGKSGLGSRIFTLGYPKEDVVYSEGYISSKNGFDGDDKQYTLVLPAGHGQSGSPVIDEDGVIMGILTAVGSRGEDNTYAVSSKPLIDLVHHTMPNDKSLRIPKSNKLGRMSREQQIEKMQFYTFSVKVYKK